LLKEREIKVDLEKLFTVEEAGGYLGYHPEHIRRLARRGELKGRKFGRIGRGGSWRFTQEDLDAVRVRLYDPEEVNDT